MARSRMNKVFSVYHAMEERGVFDNNKANAQAVNNDGLSIYEGPVRYPMMMYHPKGETVCITQGILVIDRDSRPVLDETGKPKYAGAVYGIKHVIVESEEQENEFVAKGWHYTEAQALRANPETAMKAPPKSVNEMQLERIAALEKQLAEAEAGRGKLVTSSPAKQEMK